MKAPELNAAVDNVLIGQIDATVRVRPLSEAKVASFMVSIEENAEQGLGFNGLRTPIEVRPLEGGIDCEGRGFALVAGAHRLEACRRLGRDAVAVIEYDVGALSGEKLELEENLIRYDLIVIDKAVFVGRYRDLFEAENGAITRGGDQTRKLRVWSEVAGEKLGVSEDALQRYQRILNGLLPESIAALRVTKWGDNQSALLAIAGTPPEKQPAILDALLDEESAFSTMSEAIDHVMGGKREISDEDKFFKKATSIFQAKKKTRDQFWREAISDPKRREEIRAAFKALNMAEPDA